MTCDNAEPLAAAILADYRLALHVANDILRDRESAREVVQEAVYRALVHAQTFDERRPVRPWFLRIVRNVALHETKRRGRFVEMPDLAMHSDPLESTLRAEEANAVRHAVATLSESYRAVVHLRYDLGYAYRDISKTMCIPIGTTKTLLHRARRAVKEKLTQPGR